jgi:hypothetical protein
MTVRRCFHHLGDERLSRTGCNARSPGSCSSGGEARKDELDPCHGDGAIFTGSRCGMRGEGTLTGAVRNGPERLRAVAQCSVT